MAERDIRFARVFSKTVGVILCVGLANYWIDSWARQFCRGLLGVIPGMGETSISDEGILWIGYCIHGQGMGIAALAVGAYLFARQRRRLIWLAAAYAVCPLAVAGILAVLFRLRGDHWADMSTFSSAWGTFLLAYGAGYLLAAPWGLTPDVDQKRADGGDS